jgi:DNA recombination protein RmuC
MIVITIVFLMVYITTVVGLLVQSKKILETKSRFEEKINYLTDELNSKQDYHEIKAKNTSLNEKLIEQGEYILKLKDELNLTFKNISNEIIKQQKQDFSEEQKNILLPFSDQIKDFRKRIEEINRTTIETKVSFEEQIKILNNNNQHLAKEAQDLSTAIKGNKKLQGDWGEIQLENLFKITGLNEGIDYTKQESTEEDGKIFRPDYIINLPNNRRVIIDSKVSLNNYINYVSCDNDIEKNKYLQNYANDIKNHIKELSEKQYHKKLKISLSLDYVFMFIPLERAYLDVIDNSKNDIYKIAFDSRIAIVTPSSLMPVLKTIEHLWNIEKQNKNIGKIVVLAERIHDKVNNFLGDMKKINKNLDSAKKSYDDAMTKISTGKGNILKTVQDMKELGVKTNGQLTLDFEDDDSMVGDEDDPNPYPE